MSMASERPDTDDYLTLFLQDTALMDTRAPIEFARGSIPGAVNLPLMNDEERALVGTCFRQQGQAAAIALGHELVSSNIKQQRIDDWLDFAVRHPHQGYLYCFRGGMRSAICQQWMKAAGQHYPRVIGGYKAMRRFLIEALESISRQHPFIILAGHTGSAKTALLQAVPNSIDLEGLAHHRGSAFGNRVAGQPSQIDFENRLAVGLLRQHHTAPSRPIVLEDESRLIGRCCLPPLLRSAMEQAPVVRLEVDLQSRIEHSFNNYILGKLSEWQRACGSDEGFRHFADDLRNSLYRIRRRLGGERYTALSSIMETALAAHEAHDDAQGHRLWIEALLKDYYDPMYEYQMKKRQSQVLFSGDPGAVAEYIRRFSNGCRGLFIG